MTINSAAIYSSSDGKRNTRQAFDCLTGRRRKRYEKSYIKPRPQGCVSSRRLHNENDIVRTGRDTYLMWAILPIYIVSCYNNGMGKYIVYKHTAPNGKIYIGITCRNPKDRWRSGEGYKKNDHFYRAIQKYNWSNFEHTILLTGLTKDEATKAEIDIIKKYKANDYHYGYNITEGGEGSKGMSGSKNPNYGRKWTDEQRRAMSERKKGKKQTPEQAKKHSDYMKERWSDPAYRDSMTGKNSPTYGRTGEKHPMFGKRGSDNCHSKKVKCLETGVVYESAMEASRILGINHSKLCMVCRGQRKSCGKDANGNPLHWEWFKE